jgi:hypothetical protein
MAGMSTQLTSEQRRNLETIRMLYECERTRDLDGWIALWNPQGCQTFPWSDGSANVVGREALREVTAAKFDTRKDVRIHERLFPAADADQLFAIVDISMRFPDIGRTLETQLWCRFLFDDQGQILEHQEVFDTALVASLSASPGTSATA